MTKPIRPDEAGAKKLSSIPDVVIEAFNTLIVKHWDGDHAVFQQVEVVNLILANAPELRERLYVERMLDVEQIFEEAGWSVEYDRPGYNETYAATFTFETRKRGRR